MSPAQCSDLVSDSLAPFPKCISLLITVASNSHFFVKLAAGQEAKGKQFTKLSKSQRVRKIVIALVFSTLQLKKMKN